MGLTVVTGASGMPVVDNTTLGTGVPVAEASNGFGMPVVKALNGFGMPVVYTGSTIGDWQLGTAQMPAAVLDFVKGQYYSGSNAVALNTLAQNATVDSGGLICNAGNINVLGAFLTAMKNAGGATVVAEISGGNNTSSYGILSMSSGGPDSIMVTNGPNSTMDAYNGTSAFGPGASVDFTKTATFSMGYDNALHMTLSSAGQVLSYAKNFAAVTTAQFGSYNGASLWPGRIRSIAIYTGKLSDQYLKNMSWSNAWNKPFNGNTAIGPFSGNYVNAGLTAGSYFKANTPWTMVFGGLGVTAGTGIKVLFTNVHFAPPWYGHEVYLNQTTGKLRTSLFSGWAGGAASTNLIQVEGSTNANDGKWHVWGATYDGSQTAAGIKMYVDGVPETLTTTFDNLTGPTDTDIYRLQICGQDNSGGTGQFTMDYMDFISINKVAKPASYFSAIQATRTRPSPDGNTLVQYDMREGSGTTLTDRGPAGNNGTMTSAVPWL